MPATEKTCILCGRDCSARPRVKDKDGRYACRECLQRQPQPVPTRAASAPGPSRGKDPVMAGLLSDVPDPARVTCPSCGARLQSEHAVLCTRCGFNREAGKSVRTRVVAAPREKKSGSPGKGLDLSMTPMKALALGLAGALILTVIAFAAPSSAETLFWVALAWVAVSNFVMIGAAFHDGDHVWGSLGLLQGVPILGFAFPLYYCTVGSPRTSLKINFWMAHLGGFGVLIAFGMGIFMGSIQPSGFAKGFLEIEDSDIGSLATFQPITGYADLSEEERLESVLVLVADDILYEREEAGQTLTDEEQDALEYGELRADYPPEIWAAAEDRWNAMDEDERREYRDAAFSFYADYEPDAATDNPPQDDPDAP